MIFFPYSTVLLHCPDSKLHRANTGPTWGRQNPCMPHESCYLGGIGAIMWHLQCQWYTKAQESKHNKAPVIGKICRCTVQPLNSFPPGKMSAISQTIFSDVFSLMKSFMFWLIFNWSLFLRFQLTISQHWFRWWIMTWCQIGNKPLSEPMLTQYTDSYMWQ